VKQLLKNRHVQRGQAMTEFVISASLFLIPLFLGMSLIAKYIDIKQTNVQAARYQAWEYTVWFANDTVREIDFENFSMGDGEVMSGFDAVDQPVKSTAQTRQESKKRFYTSIGNEETTSNITATDVAFVWDNDSSNPLWKNHKGEALYAGVDGIQANLASSTGTPTLPVVGDVVNGLMTGIGIAFGLIGKLLGAIESSVGFNAINTNGYIEASESMEVAANPMFTNISDTDVSLDNSATDKLNFITTASVLSDGWNAGGRAHVYNQAGGTVPTTVLDAILDEIPGFNAVWSIASALAPELMPCDPLYEHPFDNNPNGSFWLGYIDVDSVNPDRLIPDLAEPDVNNGTLSCNDAGMCDFEPVVARPEVEDRECDRQELSLNWEDNE